MFKVRNNYQEARQPVTYAQVEGFLPEMKTRAVTLFIQLPSCHHLLTPLETSQPIRINHLQNKLYNN